MNVRDHHCTDLGSQSVNLLLDLLILWAPHDRPPGKAGMANEGPLKVHAATERPDLGHQREDCVVQRGAVKAVGSVQFYDFISSFDLI